MSAQYLPFEVLNQILRFLPHETVYQCIFVCKTWNVPAFIEYYSTLKLGGEKDFHLKLLLKELRSGNFKYFKQGYLVKHLILEGNFEEFNDPDNFCWLFLCLPYLKSIDIIQCSHRKEVLKVLIDHHETLGLNHLEAIYALEPTNSFNYDKEVLWFYSIVCYAFRGTITHLRLYEIEDDLSIEHGQNKSYMEMFCQFKQLTSLEIYNNAYQITNYRNAQFHIPYILASCPKLTNLRFNRTCFREDPQIKSDTRLYPLALPAINNRISKLDGLNLKNLELNITSVDATLMRYITLNICTSKLNKLTISKKLRKDTFKDIINNEEIFLNFIRHISLANNLRFEVNTLPYDNDSPRHVWYQMSCMRNVFWNMINFVENKKSLKKLVIEIRIIQGNNDLIVAHPIRPPDLSCKLHIKNKILYFHQDITASDFFNTSTKKKLSSDFFNPFIASKPIELEFMVENCYFEDIFNYVMKKLPKLQLLYLIRYRRPRDSRTFECGQIDESFFIYSKLKLPTLSIGYFDIEDSTVELIHRYIPDLAILQIKDCLFPKYKKRIPKFELDLTRFDQLKTLNLNFIPTFEEVQDIVFCFKYVREDGFITKKLYYRSFNSKGNHTLFRLSQRMQDPDFRKTYKGITFIIAVRSEIKEINIEGDHNIITHIS